VKARTPRAPALEKLPAFRYCRSDAAMSNRSPTVRTRAISIALAVSALSSAAYGDDLRPYLNARFGSYALVPMAVPAAA
jgi:hypothetical protein